MGRDATEKAQLYAVIRVDFRGRALSSLDDVRSAVSVKEVLPTLDEAQAEVERLNRLNGGEDTQYFWQMTRLYPARAQENY